MLPAKQQVICSLNAACLASKPHRSCWLSNRRTSLALNSKTLPSSATSLLLLNAFLPHPLTNPNTTTTLFPPISTFINLIPQQLNPHQQHLRGNATISTTFNVLYSMAMQSSCRLVQLPSNQMRNNLLLSPVSQSSCLPCACVVTASSQSGGITGLGLISLPFCSCQAGEQTMPGDSSGSTLVLQERFALLPKQRLGWESRMSHNIAIFPAKKSQHHKRRSCCGSCFIIENTARVQLQCYC